MHSLLGKFGSGRQFPPIIEPAANAHNARRRTPVSHLGMMNAVLSSGH